MGNVNNFSFRVDRKDNSFHYPDIWVRNTEICCKCYDIGFGHVLKIFERLELVKKIK